MRLNDLDIHRNADGQLGLNGGLGYLYTMQFTYNVSDPYKKTFTIKTILSAQSHINIFHIMILLPLKIT